MDRSTTLILAGVILLMAAAAVPLTGLAVTQWDTDYVYTVETGDSYCASVANGTAGEGLDEGQVNYENLSSTGRQQFELAVEQGQYVVENETIAASDFQFTDDHVAAGTGCYAVNYESETYALRTSRESQRVGPMGGEWPTLVNGLLLGGLLLVLGAGSLVTGIGLVVKRRLN